MTSSWSFILQLWHSCVWLRTLSSTRRLFDLLWPREWRYITRRFGIGAVPIFKLSSSKTTITIFFNILLTVHLSMFIYEYQPTWCTKFYNKFISSLYMFRAHVLIVSRAKIVLYSLWYHHTETSEWSITISWLNKL